MKVIKFAAGFAAGYVLGAWAGRDKYEQIKAAVNRTLDPAAAETQPARHSATEPRTQATVTAPAVVPPEL